MFTHITRGPTDKDISGQSQGSKRAQTTCPLASLIRVQSGMGKHLDNRECLTGVEQQAEVKKGSLDITKKGHYNNTWTILLVMTWTVNCMQVTFC